MELYGLKVLIAQDRPKMQLAADVTVTPEFRKEMNKWMTEFFGVECLVPDNQVIFMKHLGVCFVNKRTFEQLKAAEWEGEPHRYGS